MFDDDENQSGSDSSSSSGDDSSSSESEPAPSGEGSESIEGSEPPPAGDETEPAPEGESSDSDEKPDQPLEDNEGHSDSSAERDASEDSSSSESSDSSSSSSSDSGSSSDSSDSSSGEKSVQPPSADDVGSCIMHACNAHDVPMDDDTVNTTLEDGLYKFAIRLSRNFDPLAKVHDDTQTLQTGSVEGAAYLLQGAVQIIGTTARVTARIVSVETSEILQASKADGSSDSLIEDAITGAMGDALAGLPLLGAE